MSEECIMSDNELAENELDPLQDCLQCRLSWDHCVDKSHSNYRAVYSWWFGTTKDRSNFVPPFEGNSKSIAEMRLEANGPQYVLNGPFESKARAWETLQKWLANSSVEVEASNG